MSVQKTPIVLPYQDKLIEQLNTIANEINSMNIGIVIRPEELIIKSYEEYAILKGFRNKTVQKNKDKFKKFHDKVFKSSFYDDD